MNLKVIHHRLFSGHMIFFLSGVAGLGYEIVWTRMFSIGLGHEMPSMLAVVGAFFFGLAIGSVVFDGVISRSPRPGRWYVGCELVIGIWALLSMALIPIFNRAALQLIGVSPSPVRQWFISFVVPWGGLLPATVAMGASFPAIERLVSRIRNDGGIVGGLYAANTLGAMVGTLVITFIIAPRFGFRASLAALAMINITCAGLALWGPARGEVTRERVTHQFSDSPGKMRLGFTMLLTGLLGVGYEVLGVRIMGQVLENTVYSFASALSVYLLGTAVGAALYQQWFRKAPFHSTLIWFLQGLTLVCLLGILILQESGHIYEGWRNRFGRGEVGSIAAEMVLALFVFFLPTVLMGMTFSHLILAARGATGGIGRAFGLNTLGSGAASLVFGVLFLPLLGGKWALVVVAAGYQLLIPVRHVRPQQLILAIVAVFLSMGFPSHLSLVDAPRGSRVVAYREGVMASVAVIEDTSGNRSLKVNNRFQMGSTGQNFADRRQGHIPLLLHPDPKRVLFLGLGTGITAGVTVDYEALDMRGVDLIPEVVDLLPLFQSANHFDRIPRERFTVADARRFVATTPDHFDVIVADLFHPSRDGAGMLYTKEHFEQVRNHLSEGGLFCQWLPLYQLDLDMTALIVRTFLAVFPHAEAYLAHFNADSPMLGLVGHEKDMRYTEGWFDRRVGGHDDLHTALENLALRDDLTLFGCLVASRDDLAHFAGDGPLNTDDLPRVMYGAPATTYREEEGGADRLEILIHQWSHQAESIYGADEIHLPDSMTDRLNAYLNARDQFLLGLISKGRGAVSESITHFLDSVRASGDFHTGYIVCLKEALDRRTSMPAMAQMIFRTLKELRPDDPRAETYLNQLFGG